MRRISFVILLIIFWSSEILANSRWEYYGDEFFKRGEYYRAITMFHMALFDYSGNEDKCRVLLKSAEAFIKAGYYEDALGEYDEAQNFCSDRSRLLYLRGRLFFLKKNYSMAADLWGKLSGEKFRFLEGVSLVLSGDGKGWDLVERYGKKAGIKDIGKLLRLRNEEIPQRSPVVAAILSAVLPGAGQIYTAHYGEAGMSLVVNALFGFLIWQSLEKAREIPHYGYTETAFWSFIGMGFYLGNIYGAVLSAKQFNLYHRIKYREKFLTTLESGGFSLSFDF